jgi:hypothetical protein
MEFMTKYSFFNFFLQTNENLPQLNHCLGSLQLILNHKTKNEKNNVQVEIKFSCQNMAILCQKNPTSHII